MYELRLARSARKELESLPDSTLNRVARQLDLLATHPRPRGCKKLRGARDLWRIRIGDYRVVYRVDDGVHLVEVRAIRHRKEAYG